MSVRLTKQVSILSFGYNNAQDISLALAVLIRSHMKEEKKHWENKRGGYNFACIIVDCKGKGFIYFFVFSAVIHFLYVHSKRDDQLAENSPKTNFQKA